MNPNAQVFFNSRPTLRTFLRSPPRINHTKELIPLPTHIFDDSSECPKAPVQHMLAKHSLRHNCIVKVFHKDHIASVAKGMSLFKVEILARVVNRVVQQSNLNSGLLVVLRPLGFLTQPALQQFQLALQTLKKLGRFYENAVAGCQKFLQANIYANRMTVRHRFWNKYIALQSYRGVPPISFFENANLLNNKPIGDRAMQVDFYKSQFGQEEESFWRSPSPKKFRQVSRFD